LASEGLTTFPTPALNAALAVALLLLLLLESSPPLQAVTAMASAVPMAAAATAGLFIC
jgi:hypothetical protein